MIVLPSDRWLFVCSANLIRSPTAEYVARKRGLLATSAGTDRWRSHASLVCVPLTYELLDWASVIVCMEPAHVEEVKRRAGRRGIEAHLKCWHIEDIYARAYDPELIALCEQRLDATLKELEA